MVLPISVDKYNGNATPKGILSTVLTIVGFAKSRMITLSFGVNNTVLIKTKATNQ